MNAIADPGRLNPPRCRAVFISDTHLGTRGCRADALADFLRRIHCEQLYLVGDIIDVWRLRKSWYWDAMHDEVVRLVLGHARRGTEVIYIPGNHDEMLRSWLPELGMPDLEISGVRLVREAVHTTADGRRFLVIHGDAFDRVVCYVRCLAVLGDAAYTAALVVNRWFNAARRRLGLPYWSLSAFLKRQVKQAVKAIDRFEDALAEEAQRRGMDGVICGHIHHAEVREMQGMLYLNGGDWVESCTALVENTDGVFELYDWAAANALSIRDARARPELQPA
jgi:UDP-2,3-diacylglucosamine pyrophosphatase LpxH